jgi:hypothetical protein
VDLKLTGFFMPSSDPVSYPEKYDYGIPLVDAGGRMIGNFLDASVLYCALLFSYAATVDFVL